MRILHPTTPKPSTRTPAQAGPPPTHRAAVRTFDPIDGAAGGAVALLILIFSTLFQS